MKASLRQSQLLTSILRPLLSKLRPALLPVLRRREALGADLSGLACAFVPEGSAWPGQRTFVSKVQELACVPRRGRAHSVEMPRVVRALPIISAARPSRSTPLARARRDAGSR